MSLLDVLNKRKTPAAPSSGDIEKLATTGATGKAQATGASGATSSLAGQVAGQQAQSAAEATQDAQISTAGAIQQGTQEQKAALDLASQAQALRRGQQTADLTAGAQTAAAGRQAQTDMKRQARSAEESQYLNNITNAYAESLSELASQRDTVTQDLFANFRQSTEELSDAKAAARLEQTAHAMAMSDRSYLDEITRIGAERNLMDEISFRREVNDLTFGNTLDILDQRMDAQRILNMDAREFKQEMAQMDINTAIELASQAAKAQAAASILQGTTAAGKSYLDYEAEKEKK